MLFLVLLFILLLVYLFVLANWLEWEYYCLPWWVGVVNWLNLFGGLFLARWLFLYMTATGSSGDGDDKQSLVERFDIDKNADTSRLAKRNLVSQVRLPSLQRNDA